MTNFFTNKQKIINDPVYGFINISSGLLFDILQHPYFQRLRRIKQLGLTSLVYPGANHTRFHHALGAMHLMHLALEILKSKGHDITPNEEEGAKIAILLHDIGHGPFSHALEHSIVEGITHESISDIYMQLLNKEFNEKLITAIAIFNNDYEKKYLHQLVSGQLDVDRMDYLKRDTFFTGVSEGAISYERILKMLNIFNGELVVESKGIYSIEKLLIARRLMYWQVYLHKTVVSSENLLVKILQRAKELANAGNELFSTPALNFFLYNKITREDFISNQEETIRNFSALDDNDIISSIKVWCNHNDFILSTLSKWLINRTPYGIIIDKHKIKYDVIEEIKRKTSDKLGIEEKDMHYFVFADALKNETYSPCSENITIVDNKGNASDISETSDLLNFSALSKTSRKYFLCYPKEIKK